MTRSERTDEIRFVCIDEIHTVSDSKRGYFLELLVTKIKKSAAAAQIVAMSATLRGDDALAKWMNAAFYETDFRPVPLSVTFKVNDAELDSNKNVVRTIPRQQRQRISRSAPLRAITKIWYFCVAKPSTNERPRLFFVHRGRPVRRFRISCVPNSSSRRSTITTPAWIRTAAVASSATLRAARLKFYAVPPPSPPASIYLRGASSSMVLNPATIRRRSYTR